MPSVRDLARSFDDARIRDGAGSTSFQRGRSYARAGAVLRLEEDGRFLHTTVQGNELDPYAVRIALDAAGIAAASCTCAFSGTGWCKHIVAVLVVARTAPDARDAAEPNAVSATGAPPVDGAVVSRRVRSILRSLGTMRPSEAYWHVGDVMGQVEAVLGDAKRRVEAGRTGDALTILAAITSNYVRAWDYLDDSDGFVGDFGRELAPVWTEALLSAALTAAERRAWAKKLTTWNEELTSMGLDDCLGSCVVAAAGWDGSKIVAGRTLDELVDAQLNVLRRREDDTGFLEFAKRYRRTLRRAMRLVELQRVDEAVTEVRRAMLRTSDVLAFAVFLREHGELERAATVAAESLDRDRAGELAAWLRDVARSLGRDELARKAARIALIAAPSTTAVRRWRELVPPDEWQAERDLAFGVLRAAPASENVVGVFLEEGVVADAIAVVERLGLTRFDTLARVVKAAVATEPAWAIAAAQREAERIVDAGQSTAYRHAVRWLRLAADAYRSAGREPEWLAYRSALVSKHRFKRSFIALFSSVA